MAIEWVANTAGATASRGEVRRALGVLTEPGQTTELRVLRRKEDGGTCATSHIFTDAGQLANQAITYDGQAVGTYITLNPLRSGLGTAAKDGDVEKRAWLPLDVDAVKPAAASNASDDEHEAALRVAASIRDMLTKQYGWPAPVEGDSGNGGHLLYRIDLPNDAAALKLVDRVLRALDFLYSDDTVNVDISVKNAARIWKLYGTVARKAPHTQERPQRMARLLSVPGSIGVVTRAQLEAVAAIVPNKEAAAPTAPNGHPFNLEDWMARYGVGYRSTKEFNGGLLYVLDECPWADEHTTGRDGACVIEWPDGRLLFSCRHSHCQGKRWRDFRLMYEPNAYAVTSTTADRQLGTVAFDAGEGEMEFTDTGNARRLARTYSAGLRFVPVWGWMVYRDGRWLRDEAGEAMQAAKACVRDMGREALECSDRHRRDGMLTHAKRSFSERALTAMLKLAESEPEMRAVVGDFDKNPCLLNLRNGTLDLQTGVLRAHSPTDLLTKQASVAFDAAADAPRWTRFIGEVFAGDKAVMEYVQKALGYSLTGDTSEQAFFVAWGDGCNGKSTLLNAVADLLGDYAKTLRADALIKQRFGNAGGADSDIASLVGARFVTALEPSSGALDEARVKSLTGGDTIATRELYKPVFNFTPQCKLWLATNARPTVEGKDGGIWRRIKLIPFAVSFLQHKDKSLPVALAREASGILNWLLDGMRMWRETGLAEPQAVAEAGTLYRSEEDENYDFFAEVLVKGDVRERVKQAAAYEAYQRWARDNQVMGAMLKEFVKHAAARGYHQSKIGGVRYLTGCRLVRAVQWAEADADIPF